MIETFGGDRSASLCFRQDEAALKHRQYVLRKAFRCPGSANTAIAHCFADLGFQPLGLAGDAARAGATHIRMGSIRLLDDRAGKAGEIGQVARQDRFTKLDVGD